MYYLGSNSIVESNLYLFDTLMIEQNNESFVPIVKSLYIPDFGSVSPLSKNSNLSVFEKPFPPTFITSPIL